MDNRESRLWTYADRMRAIMGGGNLLASALLVKEVQDEYKAKGQVATEEESYKALVEASNRLGIENPFRNSELFYKALNEDVGVNAIGWEKAMAYELWQNRMPLIPEPLVDLYMERFETKPETVLIAEGERFVPHLKKIVDGSEGSMFTITTQNRTYSAVIKRVFEGYKNVEVVETDIYHYEFINERFDYIMSCPAFGIRTLVEDRNFICRETESVALENLLLHLNGNGHLVIVLPGRITFAAGRTSALRDFIQSNYTIKELAELPAGILEFTGIKAYLLDVENSRPEDDDVVVRRYSAGEKKSRRAAVTTLNVTDDDTFVMLSELIEQGNWSVDRIFAQQDDDYIEFRNSNMRKDLLGNVAQVFRGKAVSRKDPAGKIGVVNISNIGEYDIDYENIDHLEEEERKVQNYILEDGDVLLPARGTAIRTAVFREQGYPIIASSNVIVIRPDNKMLDGTYLKIFLDSPIGNKIISGAQQGMAVMNISYKDLNVLEIPVPPMQEQKAVSSEYSKELERYRKTVAEAEERWDQVLAKLQNF